MPFTSLVILDILLITYRTVDMPFLVEALNLKETELKTYLQMKGLPLLDKSCPDSCSEYISTVSAIVLGMKLEGGYVQFPENQFTALKPRVMPQNIQFDRML